MTKTWFKLTGITKTPIVSRRRRFEVADIGVVTVHGRPRTFGKLTKGVRQAPMTFKAWYGDIELVVPPHKLEEALAIDTLGRYTHEGMGQIQWKEAKKLPKKPLHTPSTITIRKMLPTNLSETQHKLLIAMLLHDCVHNERHNSKIYVTIELQDDYVSQLVNNHHNYELDEREIPLLSTLQYYDRLSSSISRKFRFSATSRYRISELEKIDFHSLARDLEQRQDSLYALYSYIFKSQELKKVNEALAYGFSSLKNHLLLMVNLYINDLGRI
jgi:hypothetical protein